MLPGIQLPKALETAEELVKDIHTGAPIELELSIGITTLDRNKLDENAVSLEFKANLGVGEAKKRGNDKIGVVLNKNEKLSLDDLSPSLRSHVVLIPT